jgi:hypothetical protein
MYSVTELLCIYCFFSLATGPGRWRFFSRLLAMTTEGQNGARLGFLECCSKCVQAHRLMGSTFTEGWWGGMFVGKCTTRASTRAPRHLGVSEKKNTAPEKCPFSMLLVQRVRSTRYLVFSAYSVCFTHTVCYYSTSACERIDHVRLREEKDLRIERDLNWFQVTALVGCLRVNSAPQFDIISLALFTAI